MPVVVNGKVIRESECTIEGVCFDIKQDESGATLCATVPSLTNAEAAAATTRAREKQLRLADAAEVAADAQEALDSATAEALGALATHHAATVARLDDAQEEVAVTGYSFVLKRGERVCLGDSRIEFVPDVQFEQQRRVLNVAGGVRIPFSTPCVAAAHGYVFCSDYKDIYCLFRFNERLHLEDEVLLDVKVVKMAIGYQDTGANFDLYVLGICAEKLVLSRLSPDCAVEQKIDLSADVKGFEAEHITHMAATETDVFLCIPCRGDYTIRRYGRDLVALHDEHHLGPVQAAAGLPCRLCLLTDKGIDLYELELDRVASAEIRAEWLVAANSEYLLAGSSMATDVRCHEVPRIFVLDSDLQLIFELKEGIPDFMKEWGLASTCGNLYVGTPEEVQVYSWIEISRIVNEEHNTMLSKRSSSALIENDRHALGTSPVNPWGKSA